MASVSELACRIRAIEQRAASAIAAPTRLRMELRRDGDGDTVLQTGWPPIDADLGGGLAVGGLHEWLGVARAEVAAPPRPRDRWTPPLMLMIHLARRLFGPSQPHAWLAWIGRHCFPYPHALVRAGGAPGCLLARSLFVAPPNAAARVWAIDLALRSPAVGLVIADGSALNMAASRRIHLQAKVQGKPVFLARPARERGELSAAQTRWLVSWQPPAAPADSMEVIPRWSVELLRCKGGQPSRMSRVWTVEGNRAQDVVCVSSALARAAGDAKTQNPQRSAPRKTA